MTIIKQNDLIESIADALQYISYYHPLDFIHALNNAYEMEESSAAKDAMAQILINSRMCAEGHRPICQDTGIVTIFISVGMDIQWNAELSVEDMINEGVRLAYNHPDNKLRASIMADPAGARRNTGDNTPAVIHMKIVKGDRVDIQVAAKGGGSEAKSKFVMLNPSDDIVDWVVKTVPTMGAGWCPPGMLGIGITEPDNASNYFIPHPTPFRTSAEKVEGGWIVNGMKHFISNGNRSSFYLLFVQTTKGVGLAEGSTCFLLERGREGFSIGRVHDKMGERLANNAELIFQDCFIPDENVVGEVGNGFNVLAKFFPQSNAYAGASVLGVAEACYTKAVDWAKIRVQGGKPIIEHPLKENKIKLSNS